MNNQLFKVALFYSTFITGLFSVVYYVSKDSPLFQFIMSAVCVFALAFSNYQFYLKSKK